MAQKEISHEQVNCLVVAININKLPFRPPSSPCRMKLSVTSLLFSSRTTESASEMLTSDCGVSKGARDIVTLITSSSIRFVLSPIRHYLIFVCNKKAFSAPLCGMAHLWAHKRAIDFRPDDGDPSAMFTKMPEQIFAGCEAG